MNELIMDYKHVYNNTKITDNSNVQIINKISNKNFISKNLFFKFKTILVQKERKKMYMIFNFIARSLFHF